MRQSGGEILTYAAEVPFLGPKEYEEPKSCVECFALS
jgi:hypothetical protein